ncbi:MAG TPA: HYR domain-containing protein, partial [Verrucomicrobiae bacterium]|nr:HYR domain-containing protein [Verrucomicrobiae bacterium]
PVLTLPANMAIEATGTSGAVVTFTATALDAFDGPRPVTCVPPSGSTFPINPINSTTVNCSASDLSGNVASGSFDVAVRDTRPPVLSLPASLTLEATGPFGAAASFTATATDLVDGPLPVACVPASGSTFSLGMTTVDCSADDLSRNLASGSFTVTVQDTKPPVLTLPGNLALAATGPFGAMATFTATAADLVDGPLPVTCVPPSGATFPLGTTTVDCSAGDQAGHVVHGSFAIVVGDVTPPVVIPPAPISVLATELGGARGAAVPALAAFLGAGSANDSIDPAPVRLLPQVSGIDVDDQSLFAAGTTTVTFRYRDAAGNTGIATSTVFVEGAAAQISDLIPVVRSLGLSRKLTGNLVTKLQDAVSYLNAGKVTRACVKLEKFIEVVNAQSGKGIAPADASALIAEATRIRSVLGCL